MIAMGKLHTLRRAILRCPSNFSVRHGAYGWETPGGLVWCEAWAKGSHKGFVVSVLRGINPSRSPKSGIDKPGKERPGKSK